VRVHGARVDDAAAAPLDFDAETALRLECPGLAFLEIGLWDAGRGAFDASALVPVPDLRPGWRSVDLEGGPADLDALLCFFALGEASGGE
jgi:hypothetical protein